MIAKPPRRAGRPAAAASAETRERVLRAALRSFAADGYARTSNRQIADSAGVTSSALYHYFDSKADLYAAVHEHCLEASLVACRAAIARHDGALDQLCAWIESGIDLNRAHPGLAELLANAPLERERNVELAAHWPVSGDALRAIQRALLERGIARGELARELDVETAIDLVTAASFGLHALFGPLAKPAQHSAVLRAFQELLRGQLLAPPKRAPIVQLG